MDNGLTPSEQLMPARNISSPEDLRRFYEEFALAAVPNMPRTRNWDQIGRSYLGFEEQYAIEDIVLRCGTLLDLGCGTYASALHALAIKLYRSVDPSIVGKGRLIGVDPSIKEQKGDVPTCVQMLRGYGEDLSLIPDNSIDAVLAMEVWQYAVDKPVFLAEVLRVMRPGAKCSILIPLGYGIAGVRQLLSFSNYTDFGLREEPLYRGGKPVRMLTMYKHSAQQQMLFQPYCTWFGGLMKVVDMSEYTDGSGRNSELEYNASIASNDEKPYLSKYLFYPNVRYDFFLPGGFVEHVELWRGHRL